MSLRSAQSLRGEPGTPDWMLGAAVILSVLTAVALVFLGPLEAIAMLAAVLALAFLRRPFLLLCLIVVFVGVEDLNTIQESTLYSITLVKLVGYLLVASLLIELTVSKSRLSMDGANVTLLALGLLILASFINAKNLTLSMSEFFRFAQLVVLFLAVRHLVDGRARLVALSAVVLIAMTLSGLVGIYQYHAALADRIAGISQNASILATDLLVALGLGFALWKTEPNPRRRTIWGILLIVSLYALMVTLTRAAHLALLAGILVYGFLIGKPFRTILVLILAGIAGLFLVPGILERMSAAITVSDTSTLQHLKTFQAGLAMIADHPFLGVGWGNYIEHYLSYTHDARGLAHTHHNTFLAYATEAGLPALAVFLTLLGVCAWPLYRQVRASRFNGDTASLIWACSLLAIFVGILVVGLFHTLRASKFFWIILALAVEARTVLTGQGYDTNELDSD